MRYPARDQRTAREGIRRVAITSVAMATLLAACSSDGPTDPTSGTPLPPTPLPPTPFLVSNPILPLGTAAVGGEASPQAPATISWVSLPPGSLPDANAVTMRVFRTGAQAIALVTDGGFDPVAIPAVEGDTIEVSVQGATGGGPTAYLLAVPASSPPRVVRIDPDLRRRIRPRGC